MDLKLLVDNMPPVEMYQLATCLGITQWTEVEQHKVMVVKFHSKLYFERTQILAGHHCLNKSVYIINKGKKIWVGSFVNINKYQKLQR